MAGRTRLQSDVFGDVTVDDDISFRDPKKRILFEDDVGKSDVDLSEHMKCYLRIRPFSEEELNNKEDQKCLSIEDEQTVATHAPKDSHTFKNCTHGLGKTTHKFKFSRIFDDATTQRDFFQDTMLGLVKDFIDGQNCLVFTYGVTSSGKTYTIQGKPKDAGILPRALDVLFNSINGKQWPSNNLKPKMFMDVSRLSDTQSAEELKIKERTMKMVTFDEPDVMSLLGDDASDMSQITNTTSCSEGSNVSYAAGRASKDSLDEVFSDLENRVREEAAVSVEDQGLMKFSVWVSFAEIYNEQIFDLLEPIPKKKTTRRPVLRLSDDRNGSPYIRGLKEIHVTSADEAYSLLTVGQKNLRTACTKLNHQSSRSHCIFNIKILRVVDKGNPNHARVSMLSLCDLAGSERHSKTQSKGDRLKEAGNINTSLMTLGRCIEILRNNQHHKDKTQLIPFRDSKLTRLFQNFFCGRGKAAMIVNVNQCASMFDETLHVFKFSAVAKQVVVVQKPDPPPKKRLKTVPIPKQVPRPSIPWATPGAADSSVFRSALKRGQNIPLPEDDDDDLDEDSDSMDDSEAAELVRIIENLQQKLKEEKHRKLMMERDIREEVCKEMMEQIVKIENDYEEQLRERDILAEEMMEKRIKIITDSISTNPRKRLRQDVMEDEDDEWVSSILLHQEKLKVQKKEEQLKAVQEELDSTKTQLNKYIKEQKDYTSKNTSLQFKLADTEKSLEEVKSSEKEAKKEIKLLNDKLDTFVSNAVQKRKSEVDLGESCLLETLTQQLQQAKDQIKEQDAEMNELNAMLTEAGETFQQKERELSRLREVINEEEEKFKQQEIMIKELQAALEDSKKAVDNAEERLIKKDQQIIALESENGELQENLKNQKNCSSFLEESLRQKNEEISGWKNKLAREEGESFKREQALINGYKAEINNLKLQLHQLKAGTKVCSPVVESPSKQIRSGESPSKKLRVDSPMRSGKEIESPRKNRVDSPVRKMHKHGRGESEDGEIHFKHNLSHQIKDLQEEMLKNSSITAELESALHIARLTSEDLESRLKLAENAKRESDDNVQKLALKLEEYEKLKLKVETDNLELTKAEEEKEKLKIELKDFEGARTSAKELQEKYDELEKKLVDKTEECVVANGRIQTLQASLDSVSRERREILEELSSLADRVTNLEEEQKELSAVNLELKSVNVKLEASVKEQETELKEKNEKVDEMGKYVAKLKEEIKKSENENTALLEKVEEVETVNASLREMVNQTTTHIQEKDTKINEIVVENLQTCESPSSSDSLSNLRKKMKDLKQECDKQKNEIKLKTNEVVSLKKELANASDSKSELENNLKKVSENCKDLEFQLEEKVIEITDLMEGKMSLEAKIAELECANNELESMSKEKTKQVMELNDEMNKMKVAKEMLEEDVRDLEEERENLQTFVESNSDLQKTIEELEKENKSKETAVAELNKKLVDLQKDNDDQELSILKLRQQITQLESGGMSKEESLKHTLSGLEEQVESFKQEIMKKESVIDDMKKQIENQQNSFESQIQDLKQELSSKSGLIEETKHEKKEIQSMVDKYSELNKQLKSENDSLKDRCEQIRHEVGDKCRELEEVKKEKGKLMEEIVKLKDKISCLETEKKDLESKWEELTSKYKKLEDGNTEIQKQLEKSENEMELISQQNEEKKEEIEELQDEVEILKAKCIELENESSKSQSQSESSQSDHDSLSEAKMQIAELKSSLHMHKTLHDNVKSKVMERDETISQLEKVVAEYKLKLENNDILDKSVGKDCGNLKVQLESCIMEKENLQCVCDGLKKDLAESKTEVRKLRDHLNKVMEENLSVEKQSKKEIEKLSKACTQQEMLIREQNVKRKNQEHSSLESRAFVERIENLDKKCRKLESESVNQTLQTEEYKTKLEISEQEVKNLNEAVSQQQKIICQQSEKISELIQCEGSHNLSDLEPLKHELDRLKCELNSKSEEVESHRDKLLKVEKDLVTINNELSGKEQIIKNLRENLDQFRESECLSPTSQNHCARKLRKEKIEIENQLIEAKYKIKQLESEKETGILSSPRRMIQTEQLQRAGITSPTVHRELNRSQEREQNLRSQLQQASLTMKEKNEKISELEKKLLETSSRLREAEDSLKQRQSVYGLPNQDINQEDMKKLREEHAKRFEMIQNLEKDITKKEARIQAKSQTITELKQTIEMERVRFETALRDANANEAMIESLKNAISLQEETMEQQDLYIKEKEEMINKLQQDVEKYTDKYHHLLTTSGDSGREMRDLTRENAHLSAEKGQLEKSVAEIRKELEQYKEENLTLTASIKERTAEIEKMKIVLKEKSEECDNVRLEHSADSEVVNSKLTEEVEQLKQTIEDQKSNVQKLTESKKTLTAVIKENNEELKAMEKLLSEKRKECEEIKSCNNTEKLHSIELKCKEQESTIAEMKSKIKEKDHSLRDCHKDIARMNEEIINLKQEVDWYKTSTKDKDHANSETSKQLHHKNEEIIKLQRAVEDKTNELNNWKLERDKLVHGLEGIMKKQQKEIHDLKKQNTELEDRLSHPSASTSRSRHRSTTQKVIHIPDSTDDIVIKQEVNDDHEVFKSPPRKTSTRRGRKRKSPVLDKTDNEMPSSTKKEMTDDNITFVSEDGDTSHHVEIDATPAIAAKNLRKSRKKRSSVDLLRVFRAGFTKDGKSEKENKKSTRGRKPRAVKAEETPESKGVSRIGSIMSAIKESPITRSAKKFLEDITEVSSPNKNSDSMVEIEDHGTQMSPIVHTETGSRRGTSRKKHVLYKDTVQISEPMDCGGFVKTPEDVHTTVQRKLRGRKK